MRRGVSRGRRNEQWLDGCVPYRPSGLEGKAGTWRISFLIGHWQYSVKGDTRAVTVGGRLRYFGEWK